MDIIDIIIAIGVFLFFSFVGSKKKKKETKPPVSKPFEFMEEDDESFQEKVENFFTQGSDLFEERGLENVEAEEIFTYETEKPPIISYKEKYDENRIREEKPVFQNSENEEEIEPSFTFDQNEVYKGIIYGEILKRPQY